MADQDSGLADLHARKGKGRAASGDRSIGAACCKQRNRVMLTPHPPPLLSSNISLLTSARINTSPVGAPAAESKPDRPGCRGNP